MHSVGVGRASGRSLGRTLPLIVMVAGGCGAQHLVAGSNASPVDGSAGGMGGTPGTGSGGQTVDASGDDGRGGGTGGTLLPGCPAASLTKYKVPASLGFDPWFIAAAANETEAWFTFRNDWDTSRVGKISVAGDITAFDLPTPSTVNSLVAGRQSDVWFTETAGTVGQIGHIDVLGIVTEFPIPTSGSAPDSIVMGADGNLWFAETGVTNRIGRMTPQGVFTEFQIPSVIPGALTFAQHLAASPQGNLFLLTMENGLYVVTPQGDMTWTAIKDFGVPVGLAVGADMGIYLIEELASELIRFDSSRPNPESPWVLNVPGGPIAISASSGGSLWFTTGNDVVSVLDRDITDYQACGVEYSSGLSVSPSGAVWYTDTRGGAITRLVP